jgi:plastocyanin
MKKIYLISILTVALQAMASATTYTITTSGFTFSPGTVNANVGDTILFNVNFSMHSVVQVSSATWNANGSTPLSGGFANYSGTSYQVVMTQADAGTVYYVCSIHVALYGMKGKIIVAGGNGMENIPTPVVHPYPNPSRQVLHLMSSFTGNVSYTITDLLGQTVRQGTEFAMEQGMMMLDVSTIPDGIYVLTMVNAEGIASKSKIDIRH